ncbi:MAG: hypothetical protein KC457_11920 [Myxococcales bacterium]|nr:hypothetical protein [Myxococcales bacterium]
MDSHTARAKLESIRDLWVDACRYSLTHETAQRETITRHKKISTGTLVLAFVTTVTAILAGALESTAQTVAFAFNIVGALATSISKLVEERSDAPNKAALHAKDKHTLRSLCNEIDSLALQIIQAVHGRRTLAVADVDLAMAQLRVKVGEAEPRSEIDDGSAKARALEEVERSSIIRGIEDVIDMMLPKVEPPLLPLGDAPPELAPLPMGASATPKAAPTPEPDILAAELVGDAVAGQQESRAMPVAAAGSQPSAAPSDERRRPENASKSLGSVRRAKHSSFAAMPERAAGVVPVQRGGKQS